MQEESQTQQPRAFSTLGICKSANEAVHLCQSLSWPVPNLRLACGHAQVGYEGADMSTGIGPQARLRGAGDAADPSTDCSSAEAVGYLAKAEAESRQRLAQAAMSRQLHTVDKDDLHEMGLM